tara:strand:- start:528 stop:731 length:204 start_codon:yes stop_codon:yes gene_type:complete
MFENISDEFPTFVDILLENLLTNINNVRAPKVAPMITAPNPYIIPKRYPPINVNIVPIGKENAIERK